MRQGGSEIFYALPRSLRARGRIATMTPLAAEGLMRFVIACAVATRAAGCSNTSGNPSTGPAGWADILNGQNEKIGTATFVQQADGVRIHVEVAKLTPGTHALHLHTVGQC